MCTSMPLMGRLCMLPAMWLRWSAMRQVWPLLVSSLAMMLPVNPAPAIMKSFISLKSN